MRTRRPIRTIDLSRPFFRELKIIHLNDDSEKAGCRIENCLTDRRFGMLVINALINIVLNVTMLDNIDNFFILDKWMNYVYSAFTLHKNL